MFLKKLIRKMVAPIIWYFINKKYHMSVEEYSTPFSFIKGGGGGGGDFDSGVDIRSCVKE